MKWIPTKLAHAGRKLDLLPPPLAGEGWGGGELARIFTRAPSLSLPRKRGRGRCGTHRRDMKTKLGGALLLLALTAAGVARAEEPYPTRPLRLVVGFGAGSAQEILARRLEKIGRASCRERVLHAV